MTGALALNLITGGLHTPPRADAADPTCHGQVATIVGSSIAELYGTPGNDVIVSGGAELVDSGDGNDIVCVTTSEETYSGLIVGVMAGAGDDLIDTTALGVDSGGVVTSLEGGADTYLGGAVDDELDTCSRGAGDTGADHIITGPGEDWVLACGTTRPTTLDLGAGNDTYIAATAAQAHGDLTAGPGHDELVFTFDLLSQPGAPAQDWTFDLAAGTATYAQKEPLTFDGVEQLVFRRHPGHLVIHGSAGPDDVTFQTGGRDDPAYNADINLGGGDDRLTMNGNTAFRGSFTGAGGIDSLTISSHYLELNLARTTLVTDHSRDKPGLQGHVTTFENVRLGGHTVRLTGTRRSEELKTTGCDTVIRGRGGADVITLGASTDTCPRAPHDAYGDQGNDLLIGRRDGDTLIGGPGRDTTDGHGGYDTCIAEHRTRCEAY